LGGSLLTRAGFFHAALVVVALVALFFAAANGSVRKSSARN
jgi:hypothetical protein